MRWLSPPDKVPGRARQRQIFEPDIVEEAQPLVDFLQDARGDFALLGVELVGSAPNQRRGVLDRQIARLR